MASKSNTNSNSTVWTYNGTTYKAIGTGYDSVYSMAILGGPDATGNYINIDLNSHPGVSGVFNVVSSRLDLGTGSSNCTVSVGNNNSAYGYGTVGKTGDKVNLTVSGGRYSATFSNITITNGTDTTTVSGTVAEDK